MVFLNHLDFLFVNLHLYELSCHLNRLNLIPLHTISLTFKCLSHTIDIQKWRLRSIILAWRLFLHNLREICKYFPAPMLTLLDRFPELKIVVDTNRHTSYLYTDWMFATDENDTGLFKCIAWERRIDRRKRQNSRTLIVTKTEINCYSERFIAQKRKSTLISCHSSMCLRYILITFDV